MLDRGTRTKNRIYKTHDLRKLWDKLRKEGYLVYENEDYLDNEQAPYHLYHIEDKDEMFVANCLYRDKTEEEFAIDEELGLTPFLQEIERIEY